MERRMRLQRKLVETVNQHQMLQAGYRILVAVSGGPDSMALLHALYTLADELDIKLAVAHLNHQLRGPAADGDEAYVKQWCKQWDLPFFAQRQDIAKLAAQQKLSVEEAGRQARYSFFARLADEHDFDRVALGHTATDRIETLLINLLRGTGLSGLCGIPPRRGRFIRPLIAAWRNETAAYCRQYDLQPRLDASNLSSDNYLRNQVRLELLPLLESEYAPHIQSALLRLAQAAQQELSWTEPLVQAAYQQAAEDNDHSLSLDLAQLADMAPGLRYRLLRQALVRLRGDAADIEAVHYNMLQQLIGKAQTGAEMHLPGAISARRGYNSIELSTGGHGSSESGEAIGGHYILPVPGKVRVPQVELTVSTELTRKRPAKLGNARGRQVTVDGQVIGQVLLVRGWQPGDSFQPLGLSGHKKLQDLFVDKKVPRHERDRIPLIVTGDDQIVWVVGYRLADPFKVTPRTKVFAIISATGEDHIPASSDNQDDI